MAYNVILTLPDAATALRIAKVICARDGYTPTSDADAARHARQSVVDNWRIITLGYENGLAYDAAANNPNDPLNSAGMTQA